MSSLWEQCKTTMKQKHMRPSPKIRNILNPCKKILPAKLSLVIEYIKRISLPMLQRTCVRGSMTVEAALVLPLFCFFVISMGNAIEIIRLHGNLEVALWNAGRQICVYGALPEGQQVMQITDWRQLPYLILMSRNRSKNSWERNIWKCHLWTEEVMDYSSWRAILKVTFIQSI